MSYRLVLQINNLDSLNCMRGLQGIFSLIFFSIELIFLFRQRLTKEMGQEIEDTFAMVADENGYFPSSKLPLVLQALGMTRDAENIGTTLRDVGEEIDLEGLCRIVCACQQTSQWAAKELLEAFSVFDKDYNGYIDPSELRRVFTKIGENLDVSEVEDQLREFDIDGDLQV